MDTSKEVLTTLPDFFCQKALNLSVKVQKTSEKKVSPRLPFCIEKKGFDHPAERFDENLKVFCPMTELLHF